MYQYDVDMPVNKLYAFLKYACSILFSWRYMTPCCSSDQDVVTRFDAQSTLFSKWHQGQKSVYMGLHLVCKKASSRMQKSRWLSDLCVRVFVRLRVSVYACVRPRVHRALRLGGRG